MNVIITTLWISAIELSTFFVYGVVSGLFDDIDELVKNHITINAYAKAFERMEERETLYRRSYYDERHWHVEKIVD